MSDLDGICMVKKDGHLVPADFHADEIVAAIGDGKEVIVSIRKPRSPLHHRWFFALLRRVCENLPIEPTPPETLLLDDLKKRVGHTEERTNLITGEIEVRPKSIAFANMDEIEFGRFKERCLYVIQETFGFEIEALKKEIDETQRRFPRQPRRNKKTKVIA